MKQTPQLENGYVRISTEWMEALISARYPGSVKDFVFAIARETWGWNETWREIGTSRLAALLNTSATLVKRARDEAYRHNLIDWEQGKGPLTPAKYRVQKDYLDWIEYRSARGRERLDAMNSSTRVVSGNRAVTSNHAEPTTGNHAEPTNRVPRGAHLIDSSIDTLQTGEESSSEIGEDAASDPLAEVAALKREKAVRDAERMRSQMDNLDVALSALTAPDRALLDRLLAGQQQVKGKPLTLLQQTTQATIYAKELAEHGPERWHACCEVACSKEIYTCEFARGCVKNWKPLPKAGNPTGTPPTSGLWRRCTDGTIEYERTMQPVQIAGIMQAQKDGTWDNSLGMDFYDPRYKAAKAEQQATERKAG